MQFSTTSSPISERQISAVDEHSSRGPPSSTPTSALNYFYCVFTCNEMLWERLCLVLLQRDLYGLISYISDFKPNLVLNSFSTVL